MLPEPPSLPAKRLSLNLTIFWHRLPLTGIREERVKWGPEEAGKARIRNVPWDSWPSFCNKFNGRSKRGRGRKKGYRLEETRNITTKCHVQTLFRT